jgi:hypothetical protein
VGLRTPLSVSTPAVGSPSVSTYRS